MFCAHSVAPLASSTFKLAKHFPVWRELKLPQLDPFANSLARRIHVVLAKHFPVWRELKHLGVYPYIWVINPHPDALQSTFPFGGNGNEL